MARYLELPQGSLLRIFLSPAKAARSLQSSGSGMPFKEINVKRKGSNVWLCKTISIYHVAPGTSDFKFWGFIFFKANLYAPCSTTHTKPAGFWVSFQIQLFPRSWFQKQKDTLKSLLAYYSEDWDLDLLDEQFAKLLKLWVCLWSLTNWRLSWDYKTFLALLKKMNPGIGRKTRTQKLKHMLLFSYVYCADAQW